MGSKPLYNRGYYDQLPRGLFNHTEVRETKQPSSPSQTPALERDHDDRCFTWMEFFWGFSGCWICLLDLTDSKMEHWGDLRKIYAWTEAAVDFKPYQIHRNLDLKSSRHVFPLRCNCTKRVEEDGGGGASQREKQFLEYGFRQWRLEGLPDLIVISLAATTTMSHINISNPWAANSHGPANARTHSHSRPTLRYPSRAFYPPTSESLVGSESRISSGVFPAFLF